MSYWAFLTFNIFSIQHFLPFDVLSFPCFLPFDVLSVEVLSNSTLSFDVFYRRQFLLRHFVGEPMQACGSGDNGKVEKLLGGASAVESRLPGAYTTRELFE
jgi:hypothetical protein